MNVIINEARCWCKGKQWWWRGLLLIGFAFLFIEYLKNPHPWNVFEPLNLCIHEIGHLIFNWFGEFLQFAGGTITQLAVPVIGMWNFYTQKDFFAIALCFGWLSTNLFNISYYMADARTMQIPLVSLGFGEPRHDWNYLFTHMGILSLDHFIAGLVWILAIVSMLTCFLLSSWLLKEMIIKYD